ncbi:MAG: hypothetical protein ABII75_04940 [Candidatus Omnitrophota bacterium]
MKKRIIFSIILILSLFFAADLLAQEQNKVKLEYNFRSGAKFHYKMRIDGDVGITVTPPAGGSLPKNEAKLQGEFEYTQYVTFVNPKDKSAQIDIIYGACSMNTIIDDRAIPNPDVPALKDKKAVIHVASGGKVLDYQMPEGLPLSMQKADFKRMFVAFPERELKIGESWIDDEGQQEEHNEGLDRKIGSVATYTFAGIEKRGGYKCAKIKFESKTESYSKSKATLTSIETKVEGRVDGFIYYDTSSGNIVYSDLHTKINNIVTTQEKEDERKEAEVTSTNVETYLRTITELL